jgi:hypothetical protein
MIAALVCRLVGHQRGAAREFRMVAARTIIHLELCPRCGIEHEVDLPTGALVRVVAQGFRLPRGFGIAWVRWDTGDAVCMPVPLNVLAAAGRRAWAWVEFPRCLFHDPRQAFLQGYAMGLRAGTDQQQKGPTP